MTSVIRDGKLDSLKFLLVCLVIIGHVVGPYKDQSANMVVKTLSICFIYHYLYSFLAICLKINYLIKRRGATAVIRNIFGVSDIVFGSSCL